MNMKIRILLLLAAVFAVGNVWALDKDGDGVYQIGTAQDLADFAVLVNGGERAANAVLTSDVDLSGIEDWTSIGATNGTPYAGVFDGQGHTITGFKKVATTTGAGLFGYVLSGTVKNLTLYGTLTSVGAEGGLIALTEYATIDNVHSYLDIDCTLPDTHHVGGVIGVAREYSVITNCTFHGTLTVGSGNTDCFGGVAGYTNSGRFVNCANYGTITCDNPSCYCGGIFGYVNNGESKGIVNCYGGGSVTCTSGGEVYVGSLVGRLRNFDPSTIINNYWNENSAVQGSGENSHAAIQMVTDEQAQSGEVTYLLNGSTFLNPTWFQTIDEDLYPVLDNTHGLVYQKSNGDFANAIDDASYADLQASAIEAEKTKAATIIAQQALLDQLLSELDKLAAVAPKDFIEAYTGLAALQSQIEVSAQAYAEYQNKVDEIIAYLAEHDDFAGSDRDVLEAYLDKENAVEPCEDYPNGNVAYILSKHVLSAEELAAECTAVSEMLDKAVTNGVSKDADLTYKIANNDFSVGNVSGWTLTGANPYIAHVEDKGYAGEVWNATFDLSQTITGLPDGVYEIQMYGHARSASDHKNANYAGKYYANGIMNYLPIGIEDMVTPETAVDKENCYITEGASDTEYAVYNDNDELLGYVPRGPISCTYAYSGGRYLNHMIAVVNDGTLTLGVANPGSGATDGTWFGSFSLFYRGNMTQASEAFDATLQDMCHRAQTLVDYEGNASDYKAYPNFSQALRDQLAETIAAVATAETSEEKLALVQKFSDLFQGVYTCKQGYTEMNKVLDILLDGAYDNRVEGLTDEQVQEFETLYTNVWEKLWTGAYSEEEAREMTELKNYSGYALIFSNIPDEIDGVFHIVSGSQMKWFAKYVNSGNLSAKAVLDDDIDLSAIESWESIAPNWEVPYTGEFDGQGHKITGFNKDAKANYGALFSCITNATIKNLSLYGTLNCSGDGAGVIGMADYSTIENVHSYLDLDCTRPGIVHVGGVVGLARQNTLVRNCSFHGTMRIGESNTDCFGGIAGYTNTAQFVNCANYGEITFDNVDAYVGGMFGYVNSGDFLGLQNCLGAGKVTCTAGEGNFIGALVGRLRTFNDSRFSNNYWLEDACSIASSVNVSTSFTKATAEQMASGEITYLLNGDQSEINWYQTIGEDALPMLDPSHGVVLQKEDGTYWNEGTGIQDLPIADNRSKGIYTLTGLRVSKVQQGGIYIIDGKKVRVN